ncbi:Hypothetical protein GLP15_2361 [Giardia lamblia P15]|uniref:Uncharacterized protein n=1 Tax=Giardia intestinalis (strain P15) TaxID=658858 RepID=E1F4Y7_GIAIA|nr:Hypothetical protein GLP15_2361 [Giardia lamblia P15]
MRYQNVFLFDIPQELVHVSNGVEIDVFKPVWKGGRVSFITKSSMHVTEQATILASTVSSSIPVMHTKTEYLYYFCISENYVGFLFYQSLRDAMIRDGILDSIYDPRLSFITRKKGLISSVYINHFLETPNDVANRRERDCMVYDAMIEVTDLQIVCADKSICREKYAEVSAKYRSDFSFIRNGVYSTKECFGFILERNGCIPIRLFVFQSDLEYSKSSYYGPIVKGEDGQKIEFQDMKHGSVVVESKSVTLKSLSEVSFCVDNGHYSVRICFAGQNTIDYESRAMGDDFYCMFLVKQSMTL